MNREKKNRVGYVNSISRPIIGCAGDTGEWRIVMPVKDDAKCNGCLLCWIFCPEACISKNELQINYQYCKGCGICAVECPTGAIEMVKEEK